MELSNELFLNQSGDLIFALYFPEADGTEGYVRCLNVHGLETPDEFLTWGFYDERENIFFSKRKGAQQ